MVCENQCSLSNYPFNVYIIANLLSHDFICNSFHKASARIPKCHAETILLQGCFDGPTTSTATAAVVLLEAIVSLQELQLQCLYSDVNKLYVVLSTVGWSGIRKTIGGSTNHSPF